MEIMVQAERNTVRKIKKNGCFVGFIISHFVSFGLKGFCIPGKVRLLENAPLW